MSLRVWLPLTKDLRNQGLDDVTVTNHGATFNLAGKLGGCYKTSSSDYIDLGYNGNQINSSSLSFGGWFKFNKAEISSAISGKTYTSSAKSATGNLIGNNSYGGISLQWNSNDIYTSGSFSSMFVQSYLRTSTNGARATSSFTLPFDTWIHIFLTYNKDENILGLWINGELKYTYAQVAFTDAVSRNLILNYGVIAGGNGPGAYIPFLVNDIRIYDHCLSPMEVKELAKGLVLHYPLDRQGFGQENLVTPYVVPSSNGPLNHSGGGQTTYYGDYGITIPATNNADTYFSIYLKQNLESGKTYTLSCNVNGLLSGTTYNFPLFAQGNTAMGIISLNHNGLCKLTFTMTYTGTVPTATANGVTVYRMFMDDSAGRTIASGQGAITVTNIKLEEGSTATPWCPCSIDSMYNSMGLNETTEYDCSGYCNNGTRIGTFNWTSNTPKYAVSQVFNGTDNAIQTPSLPTMITDKNYTIAVWIYKTVIGSKGYQTIYGGPSGFEIEARNGSANETKFVPWSWGKPMASYELNEWNHCVFVHSDSDSKIYLNGEYIATGTTKTANPSGNYFIGAWNTATQQNFDGLMSDFRIYATALSASDVKSLYQNSAYIDSSGNVYGAVHSEV